MNTVKRVEIERTELDRLIKRIEAAIEYHLALSADDLKLLLLAITTLMTLQERLDDDDVTLHKLRKLLGMVQQSERLRQTNENKKHKNKNKSLRKPRDPSRKSAPKVIYHSIVAYQKGQVCPGCQCGKLYKFEPGILLRITGHARLESTKHIIEQYRCNACQVVYKAPLPEEVLADGTAEQKYGYSARAIMALDKFFSGTPYYHQSNLSDIFGEPISASTIFDQCEYVANDIAPVFYELEKQAANAQHFHLDDTHNRILDQQPELRPLPNGKGERLRTGVYSSGIIATTIENRDIILFETSLGHAGEYLDRLLKQRDPLLTSPLTMSDALSNNRVTQVPIRSAYCNAHARRQFYDLASHYEKEVEYVLQTYANIWENEEHIRQEKFCQVQRLAYHQAHSLPIMETLYAWMQSKQQSPLFEEHSAFGRAVNYFMKHYDRLKLFCVEIGAQIDNNRMEEKLKIVIRGRKLSHFYKTAAGAAIANVLLSVIATADQSRENLFDYLQVLQRHKEEVRKKPSQWLPWNYRETLSLLQKQLKPDKVELG